jgi:acetylglutamate kinase
VTDADTMQVAEMVLSGAVNKEIAHWITMAGKEADVPGVKDKQGELIRQLTLAEARGLIADGTASGGMIPKLETAIAAVESGVEAVVILDGRRPHAMLVELFTEHGAGTLVKRD